jgi:hypothetical protein
VDADLDDIITRFINVATFNIEKWADRKLLTRAHTEYKDGRKNNRILLRHWPVTAITSVYDDPESAFTDAGTEIAATDYAIDGDPANGIGVVLLNGLQFIKGTRNIRVIYTAGYTDTTEIADLEEACLQLLTYYFDKRSDESVQIETKNKNNETTRYLQQIPKYIQDMIMPYKRAEWPGADVAVENR